MNKNDAIKAKADWLKGCLDFGWSKDDIDELSEIWDRYKDEYGNLRPNPQFQPSGSVQEKAKEYFKTIFEWLHKFALKPSDDIRNAGKWKDGTGNYFDIEELFRFFVRDCPIAGSSCSC